MFVLQFTKNEDTTLDKMKISELPIIQIESAP